MADVVAVDKGQKLTKEEKMRDAAFDQASYQRIYLRDAKNLLQRSVDARRRYDYEWMVRDMFRRGYHFSRYQPTTQTVILASRQSARIPVNIVAAQLRSIRNQVTSFRPKWEILPRWTTEESKTQARYTGMLLDYIYDHLNLKTKIKETVTQGLITSIGGPWQIYYDEQKEEVRIWLIDPFDFYIDPYAEELEDAEFVIKAVRRPLDEVLKNPDFDARARSQIVSPEARLALSEYKQFMIQAMKNMAQYQTDRNSTVILFEGSFKIRDDKGQIKIRKMIWTDQNTDPLYWEDTDESEYEYALYRADINPKEIYGEGWMKHVMPINRVIDMLESSVYDYNHRVAKGRIVVDRDAGVRAIHNVHGEIVSKNRGAEVKAMDMPPLPVAVQNQIDRMGRYLEDIGGAHDASLGRVPAGVKSGVGVAELKQADSTNQDDLVDNLEDFLEEVAKKILHCIAKNYKTYKVIQALGHKEEDAKYFAVVGSGSGKKGNKDHEGKVKIGPDWLDLSIIGEDNNIRVTIGSWLGYTKEMMEQKLQKYLEIGAIDQKTFLNLMEFGNVNEIVQQTRKEMLLKTRMSGQSQPQPGQHPGEADQFTLATTENQMLLEGKPIMPDPHDDHELHIAIHQEALGQGADELVGQHIQSHMDYLGQQWGTEQAGGQPQQQAQQPQGQPQPPQPGGGNPPGQPPQGVPQVGQQMPQVPPMPAQQQAQTIPNQ